MGRGSWSASSSIRNICDAEGQGRVRIGVGPLVQRKLGCKTKVQDRLPDDEAVLWRQGDTADPSWQGSGDGVGPKPGGKDGRFHLQRRVPVFARRRESGLRSGEAGNLFLEGRGSYGQDFRREDRAACLGGFRRLPQGSGGRHAGGVGRQTLVLKGSARRGGHVGTRPHLMLSSSLPIFRATGNLGFYTPTIWMPFATY